MRLITRRTIVTFCAVLALFILISNRPYNLAAIFQDPSAAIQRTRQAEIEESFRHAWNGYATHCFGHDTLHPVSNSCGDDFGGWGATAIDTLSSAILFQQDDVVIQILEYIASLDLRKVHRGRKLLVFEVTIRHLGAMISAWDLLNGPYTHLAQSPGLRKSLYGQMVKLADTLSCSFKTPRGIPTDWVDPATCQADSATSNTIAGVGTMILEFARMSDITGDTKYVELAEKAESYLLHPRPPPNEPMPGLLGSSLSLKTGELINDQGNWGAFSDSFYEYLIKAYIYDSEKYGEYLNRWLLAVDSTIKFVGSHPFGHPEWTLLPSWNGKLMTNSMESLSYFAGGNFILGGMVTSKQVLIDYGLSIANAAGGIYQMSTTGLGPEFVTWTTDCSASWGSDCNATSSIRASNERFRLRPEVLETWYYAYRATRDPIYREWSWSAFKAMNRYCRTESGFSTIQDVNDPTGGNKLDEQESFVLAEVLKYVYLIHIEDHQSPFHVQDSRLGVRNSWVFNTEAHPFLVAGKKV